MLVRQGCKLQQAGVQPLELAFRHRVEVDATNPLLGTGALQPTKKNLGSTGIRDRPLTQTTLDLRITRRLAARRVARPPSVRNSRDSDRQGVPGPVSPAFRTTDSRLAVQHGTRPRGVAEVPLRKAELVLAAATTAILQPQLEPHRPQARALAGFSPIGSSR